MSEVGSVCIQIKKWCQKWDQFISRSRNGIRSGISLYPDQEMVSEVGSVCIQIKKWCQKWDQFISRNRNDVKRGVGGSLYQDKKWCQKWDQFVEDKEMVSGVGSVYIQIKKWFHSFL